MKLSTDEMRVLFENAEAMLPVLSKWKHKKGGIYTIYGFGFDTERESINVHYRRIGGPNYDYQKREPHRLQPPPRRVDRRQVSED